MTNFTFVEATFLDVQNAYKSGAITCMELTSLYLERITQVQSSEFPLNAVTYLNPNALEQARERDQQRRLGLDQGVLHGIPILLKDNINTVNIATSNGSAAMQGFTPPFDAFITRRLLDAGAVILGKSAMGEFAGGCYNTIDGVIRNPYHPKRSPSGSSGGSAVAVSCNLAMASVGTDTSTSVRLPAAMSGVVGLRPTTGLLSRYGIVPKNLHFDTAGPIARTVEDATKLLEAMSGQDERDPKNIEAFEAARRAGTQIDDRGGFSYQSFLRRGSMKNARVGVLTSFIDDADPEIKAMSGRAIEAMHDLGAEIVEVEIDPIFLEEHLRNGGLTIRRLANYAFREDFEEYLSSVGARLRKVQDFIIHYENNDDATALPVEDSVLDLLKDSISYDKSHEGYRHVVEKLLPEATLYKSRMFEDNKIDVLFFPTSAEFANVIDTPILKEEDVTYMPLGHPRTSLLSLASYSSVGNPEITVPMGLGKQGLPMAISIMGKPYDEGRVIGIAYDIEQETKSRQAPWPAFFG